MTEISVEMFREGVWKGIHGDVGLSVAVDAAGEIALGLQVGHIFPPWRVKRDGIVIFERQA